ncbi:hypothetical protein [Brachyspira hampsonii]|uniref:hypothetical protein n=1 Tax=Brachyspira hampsonii TaxID=1287055 RepID=UPI000D37D2D0|nr:hypothetical protein [Brachyspira hampsonii]PTY39854.1 hypothetical protein DQ06_04395 [Brachyspira hampsonii bv. II]
MNKKILTLFLVVAFSAIFAVSCNNKTTDPVKNLNTGTTESTPTGGGTSTPSTPTSADPQKKDLGKITASAGTELKKAATIASIETKKTTDETKSVALTLTLDPKVDDVKYNIKAVKREINSDDNSNQVNTQLEGKVASFKYDGTKLTLAKETTLENFEATKTDYYKVTITVSKEGYNPKDVDVYVKLAY